MKNIRRFLSFLLHLKRCLLNVGQLIKHMPHIPYKKRITEYCERNGIIIPNNFDTPKSTDKLVLVNITSTPYVLVPRSTYLPSEIIHYLTDPRNAGLQFRILDFKRCCELNYNGSTKLLRGIAFECKCQDEMQGL